MTRIDKFFKDLRDEELSNYEIAAGLGNGDIQIPYWISISESVDHLKVWDNETKANKNMGFVMINYDR
jgi:hypothetical protein